MGPARKPGVLRLALIWKPSGFPAELVYVFLITDFDERITRGTNSRSSGQETFPRSMEVEVETLPNSFTYFSLLTLMSGILEKLTVAHLVKKLFHEVWK
jgi:hypothetical protein